MHMYIQMYWATQQVIARVQKLTMFVQVNHVTREVLEFRSYSYALTMFPRSNVHKIASVSNGNRIRIYIYLVELSHSRETALQ